MKHEKETPLGDSNNLALLSRRCAGVCACSSRTEACAQRSRWLYVALGLLHAFVVAAVAAAVAVAVAVAVAIAVAIAVSVDAAVAAAVAV